MTHLYLIRHAQPEGCGPGIVGSRRPNSGLSQLGRVQAEHLRNRLATTKEIHADVLISSPLLRAKETADILAPALGQAVLIDDGVQEFSYGEGEGLTVEEFVERFGPDTTDQEPFRRITPTGDSLAGFTIRACEALDRLTRHYDGKTIVIVCHGGIIHASFIYFLGLSPLKPFPIFLNHHDTAITHWYRASSFPGKQEALWCLERYDDYSHLPAHLKGDL